MNDLALAIQERYEGTSHSTSPISKGRMKKITEAVKVFGESYDTKQKQLETKLSELKDYYSPKVASEKANELKAAFDLEIASLRKGCIESVNMEFSNITSKVQGAIKSQLPSDLQSTLEIIKSAGIMSPMEKQVLSEKYKNNYLASKALNEAGFDSFHFRNADSIDADLKIVQSKLNKYFNSYGTVNDFEHSALRDGKLLDIVDSDVSEFCERFIPEGSE